MTVEAYDGQPFSGSKLALLLGPWLVVTLRDSTPGLPWAGMWDLPGGAREPGETPEDCVLRETHEEIGLRLRPETFLWARGFGQGPQRGWFFLARCDRLLIGAVRFGDEGVGWRLMSPSAYRTHPRAVPFLQHRLAIALTDTPSA